MRGAGHRAPPASAAALLRWLLPDGAHAEAVLGDLQEEWADMAARRGAGAARLWYLRQTVGLAAHLVLHRARPHRAGRTPAAGFRPSTPALLMETLVRDLRLAVRSLLRSPGFTVAAVVALGLGAGAATAVFTLLDGVVLRPLPYASPEELVRLYDTRPSEGTMAQPLSPVTFLDYRAEGVFQDAAAWWRPEIVLTDAVGEPIRASTVEVSENFFAVLGVEPVLGRDFPRDSTLWDRAYEAVISHDLWQRRFGGERTVLGTTIRLNDMAYEVVGVMPPGFHYPEDTDVWQRLRWDLAQHSRNARFMGGVARLQPELAVEVANMRLAALSARLGEEFASSNASWVGRAEPLAADLQGVFRPGLLALFGASGVLLLIACLNVANLLLSRGAARQGEVAVRAALGAGRGRLLTTFLAESAVLGVLGTALGFGVAVLAVRAFLAWSPVPIPRAEAVAVSLPVLAFTAGLAVLVTVVFGLAPALTAARVDLQAVLRERRRASSGRELGRRALVVAEVALSVMLLAGAGLLVRSVARLLDESTGVRPGSAITMDVQLSGDAYAEWRSVGDFFHNLLADLRSRPGVAAAGTANFLPLQVGWRLPLTAPGFVDQEQAEAISPQAHTADGGWFEAMGARLLAGRLFDDRDGVDGQPVLVVNRAFAERYWPGQGAVGKIVNVPQRQIGPLGRRESQGDDHLVVGVVEDIRNVDIRTPTEPAAWFPVRQFPFNTMHVVVAGAGDPTALAAAVREALRSADPGLPPGEVRAMADVLSAAADPPRLVMLLMGVFAALALLLAVVGIYGILAYGVTQRHREIGIRMALGARPKDILGLVVGQGMGLALLGVVLGAAAAALGGRLLEALLYGVAPTDPATLATVVAVVAGAALAACAVPAGRAALLRPMATLRSD